MITFIRYASWFICQCMFLQLTSTPTAFVSILLLLLPRDDILPRIFRLLLPLSVPYSSNRPTHTHPTRSYNAPAEPPARSIASSSRPSLSSSTTLKADNTETLQTTRPYAYILAIVQFVRHSTVSTRPVGRSSRASTPTPPANIRVFDIFTPFLQLSLRRLYCVLLFSRYHSKHCCRGRRNYRNSHSAVNASTELAVDAHSIEDILRHYRDDRHSWVIVSGIHLLAFRSPQALSSLRNQVV
jgi:hypothetical protein